MAPEDRGHPHRYPATILMIFILIAKPGSVTSHPCPKFRFRRPSRDVTLALKMHQVHVNESTVQTVVEVKSRTGHSGFSAGSHKEVPSLQIKLSNTQKDTGSCRPSASLHCIHSLPPACFHYSPLQLCRIYNYNRDICHHEQ